MKRYLHTAFSFWQRPRHTRVQGVSRGSINAASMLCVSLFAMTAHAAYPDKPIKVIHGFAAGGGADILLRTIMPAVSDILGQQIIVEYRTGAGANLAMDAVAKAAPDGYTLLMGTPGLATNPSLYGKLPFEPLKDFAPISLIGSVQNVLVVTPELQVNSVKEQIALAKRKPGMLNDASPGVGTSLHLAGELFKLDTGVDIVHVAYKGGAQAQTDLLGGQVQMMFNVLPSALPFIQSGKLKALAVTGKTRAESLPDVPTMIEAGVPGYSALTWNGLLAPAGTPREIILTLNEAIVRAMKSPQMKEQLARIGQDPAWSTPEEFAAFLREETDKWSKVISVSGIRAQ
jgi:tripartite-type tricarboxylate transporter receptor subunit TctC